MLGLIYCFVIIFIYLSSSWGKLLTRSGLTYPEVSSKVYHDSFCQLGSSVSLHWVIYFEAICLHVVSSFSCIPAVCPKSALFLTLLQFVHLFCNLSQVYPAVILIYFISAAVILLSLTIKDCDTLYILITNANEMHYFSCLFNEVRYMFRTCPLSIIRSISILYTQQ